MVDRWLALMSGVGAPTAFFGMYVFIGWTLVMLFGEYK